MIIVMFLIVLIRIPDIFVLLAVSQALLSGIHVRSKLFLTATL